MAAKLIDTRERRFPAMGTDVHVLLFGGTQGDLDTAQHRINELENLWSRFKSSSEVCQLNASPNQLVVVSPETFQLVRQAIDAWMMTDGMFDPTIEASMMAAGYVRDYSEIASTSAVHPVTGPVAAPTPQGVVLDDSVGAICLPPGVSLDLGGIGKGAAADIVAELLIERGVTGCVVNLGGDMRVLGEPPTPQGWPIRLECPGSDTEVMIQVYSGAVCTTTKSKRVWDTTLGLEHHLRWPGTGRSADMGLVSVTVVGERALQCEVLTKAAYLSGENHAAALLESSQTTGLLVHDGGKVEMLEGLESFISTDELGRNSVV